MRTVGIELDLFQKSTLFCFNKNKIMVFEAKLRSNIEIDNFVREIMRLYTILGNLYVKNYRHATFWNLHGLLNSILNLESYDEHENL